jgi:HEAT repeat protein
MPLIKRNNPLPAAAGPARADADIALEALRSPAPDARWNAARALGDQPAAVPALAAALEAEQMPRVREAIVTALMRIGNKASVAALVPYIRSPDAAIRAVAIDALQSLPAVTAPFMAALLHDDESDVRILAIELVRGMPAAEATHMLCGLLEHEAHVNVCASAIDALAELGTVEALPVLHSCAARFAGEPFLRFAISTAIAHISDATG